MTGPAPVSRRRLLKVGGVLGATLAGGSWLIMRGGGDAHYRSLLRTGAQPQVLSPKELAVLTVFCDRALPEPDATHPSPRDVRVAERIDLELTFHHPKLVSDFKSALLLLEHGGWLHLSSTRFTRLTPDEQVATLERMATDGTELERVVVSQLRLLSLFFYYCDDRTWRGIHYDGPFAARRPPPADSNPLARDSAHG